MKAGRAEIDAQGPEVDHARTWRPSFVQGEATPARRPPPPALCNALRRPAFGFPGRLAQSGRHFHTRQTTGTMPLRVRPLPDPEGGGSAAHEIT
jgi:hypothetical protein